MKGKRYFIGVCLIVILALATLLGACAQPAPTQAPSPATTYAPGPVATPTSPGATTAPTAAPTTTAVKPVVWKFASAYPPAGGISEGSNWFLLEVEKRTNGRLKFERYWSGSLAESTQILNAITNNAAQSGLIIGSYSPGKTPLLAMGQVAAVVHDLWPAGMAFYDLYQTNKPMIDELAKWNAMYMSSCGSHEWVYIGKKPVLTLEDFKGTKIRALGGQGELVQMLGGVPVNLPGPEQYDGIDRGIVDGTLTNDTTAYQTYMMHNIKGLRQINWPFGGWAFILAMNIDAFNKLPADLQKVLKDTSREGGEMYARIYQWENGYIIGRKLAAAAAVPIIDPPAADVVKFLDIAKNAVWDKWVADQDKAGVVGARAALDQFLALTQKYAPLDPLRAEYVK